MKIRLQPFCPQSSDADESDDLDPDLEWPVKNQSVAKRNREDGNDAFTAGNFDLSLLLYSEAMRYSPVNENTLEGEDMAAAAANRFDFDSS